MSEGAKKIEMGKKYRTRGGKEVRIYAVDAGGEYPVHGAVWNGDNWDNYSFSSTGEFITGEDNEDDLVEVGPYDHIKIDDKVIAWNDPDKSYGTARRRRYFAGVNEDGKPMVWTNGVTSWSRDGDFYSPPYINTVTYDHCELWVEPTEV